MISASALRKLAMLNLSAEQMAGVLDILADGAEADEQRRAAQRERTRKHRAQRDGNVTVTSHERDNLSPKKEIPPTPPKEKITPIHSLPERAREFAEFWTVFPNKVGKRDAEKSFAAARLRADFASIMEGVRRYAAKTDDRPWCNPTTFLNQDRWSDQPAAVQSRPQTGPPRTVGDMFREDARRMGIIPNEQPTDQTRRMDASDGSGQGGGSGIARRFALPANVVGRIG